MHIEQEITRYVLNSPKSRIGWIYRSILVFLVLTVCVTFVWETYHISAGLRNTLEWVDWLVTLIFLVDYLVRFWSERFSIRYLFTPLAIVDLLAILPLFLSAHWQFVRVLRLFRILRLLRVLQRSKSAAWQVSEFRMRLTTIFFTLFCIIFISSGVIYDIEHKYNPEQMQTFFDALYFVVVSVTTVGYGDITPVSHAGRVATLLMICSGVLLIPWQVTELARYIVRSAQKGQTQVCSSCHHSWHDLDAFYCKNCGHKLESSSSSSS